MNFTYRYQIELTTLTPVIIGNGEETFGYQSLLVTENSKLYFIKFSISPVVTANNKLLTRLLKTLENNEFAQFRIYMKEKYINDINLRTLIDKNIIYKIQSDYNLEDDFNSTTNRFTIKEFPNIHGKFYIPGSSIKGAFKNLFNISNNPGYIDTLLFRDTLLKLDDMFVIKVKRTDNSSKIPSKYIAIKPNAKIYIEFRSTNSFNPKKYSKMIQYKYDTWPQYLPKSVSGFVREHIENLSDNEFILPIGFGTGKIMKMKIENDYNIKGVKTFYQYQNKPIGITKCKLIISK